MHSWRRSQNVVLPALNPESVKSLSLSLSLSLCLSVCLRAYIFGQLLLLLFRRLWRRWRKCDSSEGRRPVAGGARIRSRRVVRHRLRERVRRQRASRRRSTRRHHAQLPPRNTRYPAANVQKNAHFTQLLPHFYLYTKNASFNVKK